MLPRILHTYYCVTTTYSPTGKTVRLTTVQTGDKPNSSYCLDGKQNIYRDYFTQRLIAEQFAKAMGGDVYKRQERTFERLRYLLGGDRPSQTARLTMSPDLIQGHRLEFQHLKSGIPTMTPYKLTPVFPSLPPILYMKYRNPILSCSEAPWGLSV